MELLVSQSAGLESDIYIWLSHRVSEQITDCHMMQDLITGCLIFLSGTQVCSSAINHAALCVVLQLSSKIEAISFTHYVITTNAF